MSRFVRALGAMTLLFSLSGPMLVVAEDACVSKCDAEAEKCSVQAGRDSAKTRACDEAYDACLDRCKKP
jgi:hypothetical protein